MSDKTESPETISDADLDQAQGGTIFLGPVIGTATGKLKDLEAEDRFGNLGTQRGTSLKDLEAQDK